MEGLTGPVMTHVGPTTYAPTGVDPSAACTVISSLHHSTFSLLASHINHIGQAFCARVWD